VVKDLRRKQAYAALIAFVPDLGLDCNIRAPLMRLAADSGTPPGDVQCMRLRKPCMAVDPRALVVPAFIQRGIRANGEDIGSAILRVIRNVEAEGSIPA